MHPRQQLIDAGIINENKEVSRIFISKFYQEQLIKFDKLGIGKLTENGIKITPELIAITEKRLNQLIPLRERGKGGKKEGGK